MSTANTTAASSGVNVKNISTAVRSEQDVPFYVIPETLRNWPYKHIINPHYCTAFVESVGWLKSFKPFSPVAQIAFNKCDFSLLSTLTFTKASREVLRGCCDLMHTFFTLDKHTDILNAEETRVHCEATMDAVLHPDKPRPAGEPVIGEIARQFWKPARRDKSHYICTIDEYMIARRDNIGTKPTFAFLEMSLGVNIPHHVMEHPTIAALNRDTTDMIILDNDLCSYKKESLLNDADYNIVTVVMHNNKVDVNGAMQWISDVHDDIVEHFLRLCYDVRTKNNFPSYREDLDRQVEAYVEGLGQWIRGHDKWNFGSGRYFGDEGLEIQKTCKVFLA